MGDQREVKLADLSALKIDDRARKRTGSRKGWVFGLILLLIAASVGAVVVYFYRLPPEVELAMTRVAGGDRPTTLLNASGYVTPRRRSTVAAKITGRVKDIFAEEGMQVKEGQVLATLDDSDARVRLASAQSQRDVAQAAILELEVNLGNAERELQRMQSLAKDGIISAESFDTTRTTAEALRARLTSAKEQVRAAESAVVVAQQDLDNCTVTAPFAGIVVSKDAQRGEMVSPISAGGGFTRTGIATIVDMNSLEIEVDVNESYIAKVKPRQRVEATLDSYPDWHMPAKVRTVIPTADRQKATVKVRISFDKLNPRILPDMGVKVAFLAEVRAEEKQGVSKMLIPKEALHQNGDKPVIFVLREDRVERVVVTLGQYRASEVEVLSGIGEGAEVVVKGSPDLKDGQRVRVKR